MSARPKTIILDRDGVINEDSDAYIKTPDEWVPIPGSLEAIARLNAAGFRVTVVSNQSGVGRGLLDRDTLERINEKMIASLQAVGGALAGIYYCPHAPTEDCDCRKPRTGLLRLLMADLDLATLAGVPLIGDKQADLDLAVAAGARGMLVLTGKGAETAATVGSDIEIYADLAAAVDALLRDDRP